MKRATRATKQRSKKLRASVQPQNDRLPFIEHVYELRRRLFYIAVSVGVFGGIAYGFEQQIVAALLRPAHSQQFIYTSVGGGIDFLFRVCLYAGIAASIPVIVAQILGYSKPLLKSADVRFVARGSIISGVFALAGIVYGYFWGLPSALHFLLHQFVTQQIRPLVTIQSYMSFVTVYMLGSAMLFQVPLLMIFINRVKPLKPQKLLHYERWVILIAFVGSGLMNPTPNLLAQMLLAGPIILMYQVGILIIWLKNRKVVRPVAVVNLLERDEEMRAARARNFAARHVVSQPATSTVRQMKPATAPQTAAANATITAKRNPGLQQPSYVRRTTPTPAAIHRRSYVDGFGARQYAYRPSLGSQSPTSE